MTYTRVTVLIGKETGAGNADVVAAAGLGSKGRKTDCAGVGSSMGVLVSTGRKTDGAGANVVEFSSIGSTGRKTGGAGARVVAAAATGSNTSGLGAAVVVAAALSSGRNLVGTGAPRAVGASIQALLSTISSLDVYKISPPKDLTWYFLPL